MTEPDAKLARLRELLPATGAGIYLDTATRGPLPAETAAAMRDADDWELRVGRATDGRADDLAQRLEEAKAVLAALLVADPAQIVVTHGLEDGVEQVKAGAGSRDVVVVDHVDPDTGALNDPARSGSANALVVLDATLTAGAIALDAEALGVDAVVFGADRWLLGPEATGCLWLRPGGGLTGQPVLARSALLGLARSVGWLEMYVGLEWAYERGQRLAHRLHAALADIDGVEPNPTADALATTVCFSIARWTAVEVVDELRRRVFAIISPTPDDQRVRASVAWFNTEQELDRLVAAVATIAAHAPDTLPRRPPLIVQ